MNGEIAQRIAGLSDRQRRVLRAIAGRMTLPEVALRIGASPAVARREVAAVLLALGVRRLDEAAVLWWGSRAGARADVRAAARRLAA
jgi:hypothetical protein